MMQDYNVWPEQGNCQVQDLEQLLAHKITPQQVPWAADLQQQIPLYDAQLIRQRLQHDDDGSLYHDLLSEWCRVWESGPGIIVIKAAYTDHALLDETSAAFRNIIDSGRGSGQGDHFAKPGANDRIWNAINKLARLNPELFVRYYANDMLAAAATAWLGPNYQITSQVNVVNPGGEAQMPHRDYHLGFMTPEQAMQYPQQVHRLSPLLTLQGAIAQMDMPLESGPTMFLPHSQKYRDGYLVANKPEFQAYFAQHYAQLALDKGDMVFFNPALLHAAGHNTSSSIQRMANLLQISSAFGRAMETVDRVSLTLDVYPALLAAQQSDALSAAGISNAIAASAEGYAFPTNLDRDPPLEGLAPPGQADLVREALAGGWSLQQFEKALRQNVWRREVG